MAQRRSKRTAAATAESRIARAIEDESEDSNDSNYGADNNSVSSSDREEENISLDSAKKAKLDFSEETFEQNINPNSISNRENFPCSICKTKKFDQIEELRLHLAQDHFAHLIFNDLMDQFMKNPVCPMNNCESSFNDIQLVSP